MVEAGYEDRKALARANRSFYGAFEALDLEAMRAVWSEREGIRCVHPGGEMLVGPAAVHASWEAIFASTEAIAFELVDLAVEVSGDVGLATALERIRARHGREFTAEAVATNLFAREDGAWRMTLHHASPLARRFGGGSQ